MKTSKLANCMRKNSILYKISYKIRIAKSDFSYFMFYLSEYFQKKKDSNIFDYESILNKKALWWVKGLSGEYYYGHNKIIRKVLGKRPRYYHMEHGLYLGGYVPNTTLISDNFQIFTFSKIRVEHIKNAYLKLDNKVKRRKTIISIGPYINYADSAIRDEEKNKIKQKYGKILLIFSAHSIKGVHYKYNIDEFINEIERISRAFDSVFVCMYWKDIQDGINKEYENKGYHIITAGHRNDPCFLGRLKDYIDLSDMTMSNNVGTHIGYCISRDKPHYLFHQNINIVGKSVDREFKDRKNQDYVNVLHKETNEVIEAFSSISFTITNRQRHVVEKYWGKNQLDEYVMKK